jgi:hypothetical protein
MAEVRATRHAGTGAAAAAREQSVAGDRVRESWSCWVSSAATSEGLAGWPGARPVSQPPVEAGQVLRAGLGNAGLSAQAVTEQ